MDDERLTTGCVGLVVVAIIGFFIYREWKIPYTDNFVVDKSEKTVMVPVGGGCTSNAKTGYSTCSPPLYIPSTSYQLWSINGMNCPVKEGIYRTVKPNDKVNCKWRD